MSNLSFVSILSELSIIFENIYIRYEFEEESADSTKEISF